MAADLGCEEAALKANVREAAEYLCQAGWEELQFNIGGETVRLTPGDGVFSGVREYVKLL